MGASSSPAHIVVQGDSSIDAVIGRSLQRNYQYAFFSNNEPDLEVAFAGTKVYDEQYLKGDIQKLPPFAPDNEAVVQTYRKYFHLVGTHIITSVTYGSRLSFVGGVPLGSKRAL